MKATYKGKEEERRHHNILNYSFAPDKTRFDLSMHKSISKTLLYSQELWGCSASHLPTRDLFVTDNSDMDITQTATLAVRYRSFPSFRKFRLDLECRALPQTRGPESI